MLDQKFVHIVTHIVHRLVGDHDIGFLIIENLSISHQPSRRSKSLVGYTVISSDVRLRNLTTDGFGDSKTKSSLMTYFSFIRLSEKDLRQRIELVWRNFLDETEED